MVLGQVTVGLGCGAGTAAHYDGGGHATAAGGTDAQSAARGGYAVDWHRELWACRGLHQAAVLLWFQRHFIILLLLLFLLLEEHLHGLCTDDISWRCLDKVYFVGARFKTGTGHCLLRGRRC